MPAPAAKNARPIAAPEGLAASILNELQAGAPASIPGFQPLWNLTPAQAAALVYLALLAGGNSAGFPSQKSSVHPDWTVEVPHERTTR